MDELILKAKKINSLLLENELIDEYIQYQTHIKKHLDLETMEKQIKELQMKTVAMRNIDEESAYELEKVYNQKMAAFENDPMISNYLFLKEEVNQLLQMIVSTINSSL